MHVSTQLGPAGEYHTEEEEPSSPRQRNSEAWAPVDGKYLEETGGLGSWWEVVGRVGEGPKGGRNSQLQPAKQLIQHLGKQIGRQLGWADVQDCSKNARRQGQVSMGLQSHPMVGTVSF